MLRLPRHLRFEVHKVLRLPRNLDFELHQVLCLPRNLHFELHQVLCLPRNRHFEVHQVLCLPRNLHFEVHKVLRLPRLPRNLQTSHMSKSHDSLHHDHVQSAAAAPARKSALRSKTTLIHCTCHEKSRLNHRNTRFPFRLPCKAITMCENARGATTRAQSRQAPAAAAQIS